LKGLARFKPLGDRDPPPDLDSLVRLTCVDQLPSLLEGAPRLTSGVRALRHPRVQGSITIDELAESARSSATGLEWISHASTIPGQETA
jgi:hypothetical protein